MVVHVAIVVFVRVEKPGEAELLDVVQAHNRLGSGLGFTQGWEQQAGQDGDYGNDHQQLNQGKPLAPFPKGLPRSGLARLSLASHWASFTRLRGCLSRRSRAVPPFSFWYA